MITYKTAKQLKEAGFLQDTEHYYEGKKYINSDNNHFNCGGELVACPTLSELIEACGEDFINLLKNYKSDWTALTGKEYGKGKSPEEAVAKLYLKLNDTN